MMSRRSLGRQFGWLWAAYAVSAYGSGFGFGAFPLIAIVVLHAGPAEVSVLAAAGLAVGAAVAVPLGPWVEFRRKRPVMVAMDLTRFAAMMSIPAAFALGWLSFAQLLVVSVIAAAAKIAFNAASGACLKALVRPEDLLVANARFESTTWTATVLGPPLGGAVPCVGGLIGSRLAARLVARFGRLSILRAAGALRACWLLGLAFVRPGAAGLVLVIAVELGLITCMGVFNPVFATYRLEQIAADRVARTLSAWSVSSSATIAALTALWGLLASATSLLTAIAVAGLLILATPLLLLRRARTLGEQKRELVASV